ncbi:MAG: hypothetical protein CMO81_10260 [Waddliaceae bacterium]|nr:hypothetical protein [Waddliaceae bacterium]
MEDSTLPNKNILIVEDTATQRLYLENILERFSCIVTSAKNGKEGWEAFQKGNFDLVISDVLMPEMSGFELCHRIKSTDKGRKTPVMLLTTLKSPLDVIQGIECQADNFVMKPFDEEFIILRASSLMKTQELRTQEHFLVNNTFIEVPVIAEHHAIALHSHPISSLDLLLSVYENAVLNNQKLAQMYSKAEKLNHELAIEKEKNDRILRVTLPEEILDELKMNGVVAPKQYNNVAILFVDIVNFSQYCDTHSVAELTFCLQKLIKHYEEISQKFGMRKIKTIGDEFMAAGGLFDQPENICLQAVRCAFSMREITATLPPGWEVRIGIHFGSVIGGVIGNQQYAFDIWGRDVNVASRIEHFSAPNEILVSDAVWNQVMFNYQKASSKEVELKGCGRYLIHSISSDQVDKIPVMEEELKT